MARHGLIGTLVLLLAVIFVNAQAPTSKIAPAKTIRAGVTTSEFYWPMSRRNGSDFEGFEPALARLIADRMGANLTFVPCPSLDDRFKVLRSGAADFSIAQITYSPEREKLVRFIRPFYYESGFTLFTQPGLQAVDVSGGWDSLRGKAVCVEAGSYAAEVATNTLGLTVVPLLVNSSDIAREAEVLSNLRSNECIGSLCDSTQEICLGLTNSQLPAVSVEPYAIAIALDAPAELETALSAAMVAMLTGGSDSAISRLESEWVTPNGVAASAELPSVVEAVSTFSNPNFAYKGIPFNGDAATGSNDALPTVLRIGIYEDDAWPMSRPVNASGNATDFEGFEPAIARSLCTHLNVSCDLVPLATLDDRFTSLEENKIDAVVSSITVTPERAARVQLLHPYYFSSGSVAFLPPDAEKPKSWNDLKGKTVCVQVGDVAGDVVQAQGVNVLNVTRLDAESVAPLVANGSCIGVVSDNSRATELGTYTNSQLPPLDVAPYAVAVKNGNNALGNAISAALVDMMGKGNASELLQLEKDNVVPYGVPTNEELPLVVDGISNFALKSGGAPVSAAVGGLERAAIWTVVATAVAAAVLIGL